MPAQLILQTPGTPSIFAGLSQLVLTESHHRLRVAVAFATYPGVQLLTHLLDQRQTPITVLAVVGLDRSMTEPKALEALMSDQRVDLRVFTSPPNTMLHAKAYFFDGGGDSSMLIGSCNLSRAALTRNRESAIIADVSPASQEHQVWDEWWQSIWNMADPCNQKKIEKYRSQYNPSYSAPSDTQEVQATEPTTLYSSEAERLWMGTGSMTGGGATQLEFPRETVAFFLDPTRPPAGLALTLTRGSDSWPDNHMAFYENAMWRINLSANIPEVADRSLPYKYVLFQRTSTPNTYHFEVVGDKEVANLRAASQALDQWGETSTRHFGWL